MIFLDGDNIDISNATLSAIGGEGGIGGNPGGEWAEHGTNGYHGANCRIKIFYSESFLDTDTNYYYGNGTIYTTAVPSSCEGDFDTDGDVDGSDLAVFAADFGRTDCGNAPPCEGDFDVDRDVDGSDLATFASDFGRTDCPPDGPAPVEKTGQTWSYFTGDDGDLEKSVAWPNPRFTDNEDGTVTDNLTGLIWLMNANYNDTSGTTGMANWPNVLAFCNALESGQCGLSDGSVAGDWRLPNLKELLSLIDYGNYNPALPWDPPFTGLQAEDYWSSTTHPGSTAFAWAVGMDYGIVGYYYKAYVYYVWPVRGNN